MLEKLPIDFVRKIYNYLTTGNEDVNFYCMCIQNQNREAATNSPIRFALTLLKVNILCRLPFSKKKLFSEAIGGAYLSGIFVRPAICELASGMLDNSHLIADIFGCAVTTIKSKDDIFGIIEEEISVKGFAQARRQYDDCRLSINEIYAKINQKLKTVVSPKFELMIMKKYFVPNKYVIRLLDIAKCNGLYITAFAKTSYPREYVSELLEKFKINADRLLISCENEINFKSEIIGLPNYTGVLSSDYKGFIRKFIKHGCKPIYYRNPQTLMAHVGHPKLSAEFKNVYDSICGLRLFSGFKRVSREYELSFMCIAPSVYGFAEKVVSMAKKGEYVICLCDEFSIFGRLIKSMAQSAENIVFFPWSPLASDKYKSVEKWKLIVEETPVFDYAYSGILDSVLRYPVSELNSAPDINMLAGIMATAWSDKSSDGVNRAVAELIGSRESVTAADPVAGYCGSADFCGIISAVKPGVLYKCLTVSNYLGESTAALKPLAEIVQGGKPLLCQIGENGKKWLYPKKPNKSRLGEIYRAILDFSSDFREYANNSGTELRISGEDAAALYIQGLPEIRNI